MTYFLFCSNLYVYHITVVTTYGYINYCFVSTYVYECMIDFICNNLYLICGSNSCIIDVVFVATFVLHVWKNYFCSNLYINLCVRQLTPFTTHAYDMLCLWQFVHMTDSIFMTTYVHNKLWFCANFVSVTTYKYFYNYYIILYVW